MPIHRNGSWGVEAARSTTLLILFDDLSVVGSGDTIPISKALPADLSRNLSLVFGVSNFSDSLRPVATSGDIIRNSGRIGLCPTRAKRCTTSSAVSLLRRAVNNRTLALARRWGHPQFVSEHG